MEDSLAVNNALLTTTEVTELSEGQLALLNPQIAEAIRAIQAERSGTEDIEWQDFSSHSKT